MKILPIYKGQVVLYRYAIEFITPSKATWKIEA